MSAGATYQLDLPNELQARGVHNAFHASLLRIYVTNCDTRFPGRQFAQLAAFGIGNEGWGIDKIRTHSGSGNDALFELIWTNGETTWEPLNRIKGFEALVEYLEAMGVKRVEKLPPGNGIPPSNDPETYVGVVSLEIKDNGEHKSQQGEQTRRPASPIPPATPEHHTNLALITAINRRVTVYTDPDNNIPRVGNPYHPKALRQAPIIRCRPHTTQYGLIDVAVATTTAGTTLSVAKEIKSRMARITPDKREDLNQELQNNPTNFFHAIDLADILERTVKSAEKNAGKARTNQTNPESPQDHAAALVPLFKELICNINHNNGLMSNLAKRLTETPSSTNDPRIHNNTQGEQNGTETYGVEDEVMEEAEYEHVTGDEDAEGEPAEYPPSSEAQSNATV